MKIGILTQPLLNNYGGLLQNYALQHVLRQMGAEPETIDHGRRKDVWWKAAISTVIEVLYIVFHPSLCKAKRYQLTPYEKEIVSRNTCAFIGKYITRTQSFRTNRELDVIIKKGNYDGYVVGSDQCWRPCYSGGFWKEMFLSFIEKRNDIKRIAYAASFGTDQWEYSSQMTSVCKSLANKFDLITVRESSGVNLCREYLGVDAVHVLDPTMLLSREDYVKLVEEEKEPKSPGDLFYYILDPSSTKTEFIQRIAKTNNIRPFTVLPRFQAENRKKNDVKEHIEECVYPSVTSWLRGFMDAKMVIVDSFHGAVFSIIFNKPFWVMANQERGNARFDSLLTLFELEDRLIQPANWDKIDFDRSINWEKVNSIREKEQERCTKLLLDALK